MKETLKILLLVGTISICTYAQGTAADYERAGGLKAKYEAAVVDVSGPATWIGNTHRFWYRKLSRGAYVYMIFDVDTSQKNTAFDHDKIAAALSKLTGNAYKSQDLQLAQLRFDNGVTSFNANPDGTNVRCTIADSVCTKTEFPNRPQGPVRSPDGKWDALIVNFNLAIRAVDAKDPIVLSTDGSEGNYYNARTNATTSSCASSSASIHPRGANPA